MLFNFVKKIIHWIKNNLFLIFSLSILIITFILITLLSYFLKNIFWNFVKDWQSIFLPFLSFLIYILFYCILIIGHKLKVKVKWQKQNNNKINELIKKHEFDGFIKNEYKKIINQICNEIKIFFENQTDKKQTYSTNILLFSGNYGSGKTFVISNVFKQLIEIEKLHIIINTYYIDISIIENESKNDFTRYLFNEIIKCIDYQYFLKNFQYLKFFNIFTKKIPFNFVKDNINVKNINNKKILIVLDELDRCNPNNIINTLSVLKSYFSNVDNVIIIIIASENIIKPILLDYLKLKNDDKNKIQICYENYLKKIINKSISIKDKNYFNFSKIINNNLIKNVDLEFDIFLNENIIDEKWLNPRNILKKIENKNLFSKFLILQFLRKLKNTDVFFEELYDLINLFSIIKIFCNIIPNIIDSKLINKIIDQYNILNLDVLKYWHFLKIINIKNQDLIKITDNKNYEIQNINNEFIFTCLTTDNQGNLYGCTINNEIMKINNVNDYEILISLNKNEILKNDIITSLTCDNQGNLYGCTINQNYIFKINIITNLIKNWVVFDKTNTNTILFLTCDNQGNLYGCTINNEILKLKNEENSNLESIYKFELETKVNIFKIGENVYFWNNFVRRNISNEYYIINSPKNSWNSQINKCFIRIDFSDTSSKIDYLLSLLFSFTINNKDEISQYPRINLTNELIELSKRKLFSFSPYYYYKTYDVPFKKYEIIKIYCLSLVNNGKYIINNDMKNFYSLELEKKFFEEIMNKDYSKCWVFENKIIRKMNFFDYYYVLESKIIFKIIHIGYFKNNSINSVNHIFLKLNELFEESKLNLAICLEENSQQNKIIFDFSKIKDWIFENNKFENFFWQLANKNIKENRILKKYNNVIHEQIINLLNSENNDEIEKNITKLKKYITDNKKNK